MDFPFVGPSYVYPSINFDSQRSINHYPASSESGDSKARFILNPTPGRALFAQAPVQSIRGMIEAGGLAYIVAYNKFYLMNANGVFTEYGTITSFAGNVSMSYNGLQIIIVDGTVGGGWIYTIATNAFAAIIDTSADFPGGTTVSFLDGYFIVNVPNTGIYQWSALYNGLTWDPTDFANAEGSPDNLVAVIAAHRQVFLMGGNTVEVIYNTGASPNPFERVQGVFIQYGTNAPFSVQQVANTIFWLGRDQSGANTVWMAQGYQPQRISTTPIENYLSQYDSTNAIAYTYQENGHYFYILNVVGAPTSVCYDISEKQWHERARWIYEESQWKRDRPNFHIYAYDKHLVGDFQNGNIYEQSLNYNKDADILIRRVRISPYFSDQLEYLIFTYLQIDMQTGVGLNYDTNPANSDPKIGLSWSNDGGHTWSSELMTSMGKIGEYNKRAIWRKLGRARQRVFQTSVVSDVSVNIIAAHTNVVQCYA